MDPIKSTVGFAILGTGVIAEFYRQAITANAGLGARLVAVGHYDPAQFNAHRARFGVPCLKLEELLAHPEVDVLCVCTPSGLHASQAIAAAGAGKHVLLEKPMALSLEEADATILACQQAGVQLGVALQNRTRPIFQHIRQAIANGELGELNLGAVILPYFRPQAYYDQAAWRGTWDLDGGGILMNQGIHIVDLLVWFMGDPLEVQAYAGTLRHTIEVEDTLVAILRFSGGALGTITATTTAEPGFAHRIEIYGTRGGFQVQGESLVQVNITGGALANLPASGQEDASGAGPGSDPKGIGVSGHSALVRDFILALREHRPPVVDGAQGRRSLATVLSIYQAAGLMKSKG